MKPVAMAFLDAIVVNALRTVMVKSLDLRSGEGINDHPQLWVDSRIVQNRYPVHAIGKVSAPSLAAGGISQS